MIRNARKDDLGAVAAMARALYGESKHPHPFKAEVWIDAWEKLLDSGVGLILVDENPHATICGVIAGAFFPDLNNGTRKGAELLWYVRPDFRGHGLGWDLYRAFEAEARNRGVDVLMMGHLADNDSSDTLRKFYLQEGFTPVEVNYAKDISHG